MKCAASLLSSLKEDLEVRFTALQESLTQESIQRKSESEDVKKKISVVERDYQVLILELQDICQELSLREDKEPIQEVKKKKDKR